MAIDLAKNNIRVNTVCPTFVVTPMTKKFLKNKKFKNNMLKSIPLGRFADVSDIATAVTFLASNASSMKRPVRPNRHALGVGATRTNSRPSFNGSPR